MSVRASVLESDRVGMGERVRGELREWREILGVWERERESVCVKGHLDVGGQRRIF